jgi:hypothetical protein
MPAVNPAEGVDGSKVVTVEVIVLVVGFAFAGLTAKPRARARLATAVNNVLKIFFTVFLENLLQQDAVAYLIPADSKYAVGKMFG